MEIVDYMCNSTDITELKDANQSAENDDLNTVSGLPDTKTKLLVTFLYVTVIFVAVGGNAVVCYTVLWFQQVKNVTSYFIVNLACSDMLMASVCIPFTFVSNLILMYWPFGAIMCPLVCYLQTVFVFVSAYTMVAVSIDRYIAIVYPMRYRLCKRHAVLMIIGVWGLSLTISLPTALTSTVTLDNGVPLCQENWQESLLKYHYSLVVMVLQYFLPILFLSFAYSRVAAAIWFRKSPSKRISDARLTNNKQKMVKIMMIIVILYAICWLPLHVVTLLGDQNPALYDRPFMPIAWISFHWLAMSNSCYNPFIYYWMSNTFKLGFKSLLICRCCVCKHRNTRHYKRGLWRTKARKESPCRKSYVGQNVLGDRKRCIESFSSSV
ncbi:RYamide receptor-like [Liolophura sinensis]|uniref:RYamide receptor-like n=1 Tax=Liolophura sinensis TaxID=3198878 RepID=UPI003157F899